MGETEHRKSHILGYEVQKLWSGVRWNQFGRTCDSGDRFPFTPLSSITMHAGKRPSLWGRSERSGEDGPEEESLSVEGTPCLGHHSKAAFDPRNRAIRDLREARKEKS